MPRFNSAIDTAARFGDIPFVEFTQELITGVFDSLVEAHILQVEEYAEFVQTLTQDLSSYINNTNDGVSFDEISDFVLKYELPTISESELESVLDALESPSSSSPVTSTPATTDTWWGGLMNALAPAVDSLVDKIPDPSQHADLEALSAFNNGVTSTMPNYQEIYSAIASLISSNKYSILQNMAQQGMMRLVVTDGEIETKITFSTWQEQENTYETKNKTKVREKSKMKLRKGALGAYKKAKRNEKRRQVTVNTAKSYHRDTSGTKVDIFGRVMIRFKTDYAPLNG